ncbi:hypothetical protein [uncultured Microbacterium sp.]|uniref:hypothetical protein n=1 Tax=uncultured Microbacterium sp. TaxID=191216 RepID=UPI0026060D00|nr:hypothetical protein [uncultured Microbacterium sp.]
MTASHRRPTLLIAVLGVVAVCAYAVAAAVQILVLNPLAAVPGATIEDIRGRMAAANETPGTGGVVFFLGIGVLVTLITAIVCVVLAAPPLATASAMLVLVMLGAPGYFVASFGPGMALADTFWIAGGDHSPGGAYLAGVSALAGIAAIVIGAVTVLRARREAQDIAPAAAAA